MAWSPEKSAHVPGIEVVVRRFPLFSFNPVSCRRIRTRFRQVSCCLCTRRWVHHPTRWWYRGCLAELWKAGPAEAIPKHTLVNLKSASCVMKAVMSLLSSAWPTGDALMRGPAYWKHTDLTAEKTVHQNREEDGNQGLVCGVATVHQTPLRTWEG